MDKSMPHGETDHQPLSNTNAVSEKRQNLAGGVGVFANFFEEMAEPVNSESGARDINSSIDHCERSKQIVGENYYDEIPSSYVLDDDGYCAQAFYCPYNNDDDLNILNQYRQFVNRSKDEFVPANTSLFIENHENQWDVSPMGHSSLQPLGLSEYLSDDLDAELCIPYTQRCKPPKVLANRFLLGATIGRGSYGKVKDAIDLVSLRRHAVKIISKLGVRKIPGGWTQALLEANVMRRLPPHRHVVSLVTALRVDSPDRLCIVMEHCLGSVHDLQAAGVPSSLEDELDDDADAMGHDCTDFPLNDDDAGVEALSDHPTNVPNGTQKQGRTNKKQKGRFRITLPLISTDVKLETKKITDAMKRRKISNVETGRVKKCLSVDEAPQQQFRRLSEGQAHAYFLQLIDGLHFLHRHGVIHRDIKPGNLLLTPTPGCGLSDAHSLSELMDEDGKFEEPGFLGRSLSELLEMSRGWLVKLTDFGVSASLSAYNPTDQVNGGQITPAVQPPEVAKGVQSLFVGSKLDVYSAGVTLYFMLTGRVPFACQNVLQIFEAIAQGDYNIPGHVSSNAANLVRKMMCKDPKKRITLKQLSSHPWVTKSPPKPLMVDQIRAIYRTQSSSHSNRSSNSVSSMCERGIICWLDPYEFLSRPGTDYAPPHVDDTGARIFTELELLAEGRSGQGSTSSFPHHIAPISIVEKLKIHHTLTADMQVHQSTPMHHSVAFGQIDLGLETEFSRMSLEPSHHPSTSPFSYHSPNWYQYGPRERHYSGAVDLIDDRSCPTQSSHYHRQRGQTICLPTQQARCGQPTTVCNEPPACPADLPVSPIPHAPLLNLHIQHASPPPSRPDVSPGGHSANFCLGVEPIHLSPSSNLEVNDATSSRLAPLSLSGRASHSGGRPHTKSTGRRRITQWFISSISSFRNRFRRPVSYHDPSSLSRAHTSLSCFSVNPEPISRTVSAYSEPPPLPNTVNVDRVKSKKFSLRRRKTNL